MCADDASSKKKIWWKVVNGTDCIAGGMTRWRQKLALARVYILAGFHMIPDAKILAKKQLGNYVEFTSKSNQNKYWAPTI